METIQRVGKYMRKMLNFVKKKYGFGSAMHGYYIAHFYFVGVHGEPIDQDPIGIITALVHGNSWLAAGKIACCFAVWFIIRLGIHILLSATKENDEKQQKS